MKFNSPGYILMLMTGILILLGVLILAGVSAPLSFEKFGNTYYFLQHQILFGLIPGFFLLFIALKTPLSSLKKRSLILLLINLAFLALVFIPKIGSKFWGASRWISLGPISFQPSEFLKLTFILYLATWFSSRIEKSEFVKKKSQKLELLNLTFIAFLAIVGIVSLLLIRQPDVTTLGIIVVSASLMYFSLNTPLWHIFLIILMGTGGLYFLIKGASYRVARWLVFLKPEIDPMGRSYQIKQVLITIGSGGITGLGLGMSQQKFGFLPQSMSDSIFAVFSEETGFLGGLTLILLFIIFLWQGFKIGKLSQDTFSKLASIGITSWIVIQAFVNIGSMTGILPLTGIPLPFISYGGSHLIAELAGVGILLNISKTSCEL